LVDSSFVCSRGGKSTLKSTAELIYPVEWDPGETSQGKGEDRRNVVPKVIDGVTYWPPIVYPHPVTFNVRPVGTMLDMEAVLSPPGDAVQVTMSPEFVRYEGKSPHYGMGGKTPNEMAEAWLPVFTTMRSTSSLTMSTITREWTLVAPLDADSPVLVFSRPCQMKRELKPEGLPREEDVTVIAEFLKVDVSWFQEHVRDEEVIDSLKLRAGVQGLIESGEAQVIGIVSVSGSLGKELASDGIRERIYPTEWDPAEIPSPNAAKESLEWPPSSFPAPTAYETRNLGGGIDALIHDNGMEQGHEIRVGPNYLIDAGDLPMSELVTPSGNVIMTTMPLFMNTSVDSTVFAHRGETILLGALTPRGKDILPISEKRVLVFVRLAK
jgi:hypothetical protein